MSKRRLNFEKIAVKRTNHILKKLKLLGNCSNHSFYEYYKDDVEKIFGAIESQIKKERERFIHNHDEDLKEFEL